MLICGLADLRISSGGHQLAAENSFVAYIDDAPIEFNQAQVTGQDLMTKAGGQQLVEMLEDGSQRTVDPGETFDLQHAKHFKRPPHFKRG